MTENLIKTIQQTLGTLGIQAQNIGISKEPLHNTNSPFCIVVGLVSRNGDRKGIFSLEFDESLASHILSVLMPGYELDLLSEMGMSAILEFSNILCGNMISAVAPEIRNTPPTAVYGKGTKALLNTLPSYKMKFLITNRSFSVGLSIT